MAYHLSRLTSEERRKAAVDYHRYVEPGCPYIFEDWDGIELETSALVALHPRDAFRAWIEIVWYGGGGLASPTVIDRGDRHSAKGSIRKVPLGIIERILESCPPEEGNEDKIATIMYTLESSVLPMMEDTYLGFVSFIPDLSSRDNPRTLIVWRSKFTPSSLGSVVCCGGTLLRVPLHTALVRMLTYLREQTNVKSVKGLS